MRSSSRSTSNVIPFPIGGRAGSRARGSAIGCLSSDADDDRAALVRLLRYLERRRASDYRGPDPRLALKIGLRLRWSEVAPALESTRGKGLRSRAAERAHEALLRLMATLDDDESTADVDTLTASLRNHLEQAVGPATGHAGLTEE